MVWYDHKMLFQNISTSKERSQILEHYKSIWRDYETKYKSFPLAQTLLSLQAENKQLEEKLKEEEEECGELKEKLANFSGKWLNTIIVFHPVFPLLCHLNSVEPLVLSYCKD